MKTYKTENPEWSDEIDIFETTDAGHASCFNKPVKKLFENTLYLRETSRQLEKNILSIENSVSVIDDATGTVTTTYADGTRVVSTVNDSSIIETVYDADGNMVSKMGTYITDDKIEVKELEIDEE